jgi:outer membrane protein OmpA-like peptidoglycan-associated protein
MYVNDQRAVDLNQVELKSWSRAVLDFTSDSPVELGTVRIAESAPDISQVLTSTGKYVSHAIQFETGSDQLRPESLNVIKEVATALEKQPALKLRIEGHTDSTGDATRNLDLSKRRADSVKGALVKMGIGADRLTTEGFGQTKPMAPNDTPQGRAENRRVEFVKI